MNKQFVILMAFAVLMLNACTDPDLVGVDLQPANEIPAVGAIDTFTIRSYAVAEDSLVIWSPVKNLIESPTLFLGSTNDVNYGKSFAGFLSQIRIGNTITSTTFNGATTPDSIVLSFNYKEHIGDTSSLHHISVYELGESVYTDSTYYSGRSFAKGNLVGHTSMVHNLRDSVVIGGSNAAPQLRLPLDTAFGGKLLREYISNPTTFGSNSTFLDYLKGLIVVDSADGQGSVLTLSSTSGINKMTLYFSGNKSYEFLIDVNSVRFSFFKHELLSNINDHVEDNPLVIQSMASIKDSIFIPYLKDLYKDGPVAIGKAELVLKVQSGSTSTSYPAHSNLLIFASDSLGKNTSIQDAFESSTYYGGVYNETTQEYRFNIARHLQRNLKNIVENGGTDYGLFLVAGGSTSNARKTILQGGSSMKLIITYTKINP